MPHDSGLPPIVPAGMSGLRRTAVAAGVCWTLACLYSSFDSPYDGFVVKLVRGVFFGGAPWGIWWVLRGFKRPWLVVGWFVGAIALICAVGYGIYAYNQHEIQVELEASYHRINESEIDLNDFRLGGSDTMYPKITGRIRNRSEFELTGVELKVQVLDCAPGGADCDLLATPVASVSNTGGYHLDVPPLQSADVTADIHLSDRWNFRKGMQWRYRVASIQGKSPKGTEPP